MVDSKSPQPLNCPILPNNPEPFADEYDYKIIYNDWLYGLTSDITHVVVWMKTRLAITEQGELTAESRTIVEEFVDPTFIQQMRFEGASEDSVIYFKNDPKLQSVGVLEHFHVLLRGASKHLLDEWTRCDVPMYLR